MWKLYRQVEIHVHDVLLHELGAGVELHVTRDGADMLAARVLRAVEQIAAHACARAVADGGDPLARHGGEEADVERVVHIDVVAERPGEDERVELLRLDAVLVAEREAPGADRAFGELDLAGYRPAKDTPDARRA